MDLLNVNDCLRKEKLSLLQKVKILRLNPINAIGFRFSEVLRFIRNSVGSYPENDSQSKAELISFPQCIFHLSKWIEEF